MISERLKQETRAAHDAIEGSMGHLMSANLTRATYARLLERFYGFHADVESRTHFSDASVQQMFDERRRAQGALDDLRTLGTVSPESLPRPAGAERVDLPDEAAMLGVWYVLEGSTLGGQVITRHLETHLALTDGTSYFRGAGPMTMPRWKTFKAMLDGYAAGMDGERLIASANQTFDRLGRWLAPALPKPVL